MIPHAGSASGCTCAVPFPELPLVISIIVPVYNCEAFLDQCLQSILGQTHADLEVLLINDGSVDGSRDICDRYAQLDARVRVFHRANGGVSSARNLGIEKALGEFLLFVDADDYVEHHFVSAMLSAIEGHDVAACGYDRVRPGSSQPFSLGLSGTLPMESFYEHALCTQFIGGGCCNKVFSLQLIREMGLTFDTRIAVGEDMLFLVQYFRGCRSAGYCGEILYHYRFNEVSATESGFAEKKVTARTASILQAVAAMEAYSDPARGWQLRMVRYRQARSALRLFVQMVLSRTDDQTLIADVQRTMRRSLLEYLGSRHARWLEKVMALVMAMSTRLAYALVVTFSGLLGRRLAAYRT